MFAHAPNILSALTHLNNFFDFGVALPLTGALVVSVVTAFIGFAKLRRGTATSHGARGASRALVAVAVIVVGLAAISGVLHLTGRDTVTAANREGAVLIAMKNTEFTPTEVRLKPGEPARIVVENRDLGVHTFTIEALARDVSILGGSEKLIELPALTAGTYEYICAIPGHDDMKGRLVVAV